LPSKTGTNPTIQLLTTPLNLDPKEMSRVIAIAPDQRSFLLGSAWLLRRFDSAGNEVWKVHAPAGTDAVNIASDGKTAIAAFGDGTIRWFRYSDGKELAAFFPHADRKTLGTLDTRRFL
jgi:hypothetical protein